MKFSKIKSNIIIDCILYLNLLTISFTGLLLKFVLIPGSEENQLYGKNVDLYFLNLNRHAWGNIHFILSLCFIGLTLFHLILHWKQIKSLISKLLNSTPTSKLFAFVFLALTILAIGAVAVIKPEIREHSPKYLNQTGKTQTTINQEYSNLNIEIWGSMSLKQVANKYQIPLSVFEKELSIPISSKDEKIGVLKRRYGFSMQDLKTLIRKNSLPQ